MRCRRKSTLRKKLAAAFAITICGDLEEQVIIGLRLKMMTSAARYGFHLMSERLSPACALECCSLAGLILNAMLDAHGGVAIALADARLWPSTT